MEANQSSLFSPLSRQERVAEPSMAMPVIFLTSASMCNALRWYGIPQLRQTRKGLQHRNVAAILYTYVCHHHVLPVRVARSRRFQARPWSLEAQVRRDMTHTPCPSPHSRSAARWL